MYRCTPKKDDEIPADDNCCTGAKMNVMTSTVGINIIIIFSITACGGIF